MEQKCSFLYKMWLSTDKNEINIDFYNLSSIL